VRNVGKSLVLLGFAIAGSAALGQAILSIRNGKPETPVIGLPFSADESVRIVQHLANGMTLSSQMKGRVYRSSDGVERLEGTLVSTDPAQTDQVTQVWILDRTKRTAVLLNSKLITATVTPLPADSTVTVSFLPQPRATGPAATQAAKPENPITTDLGKRTQDMLPLVGTRVTSTIPVGKIGNDQPILVTTDVWVAPQLKLVVNQIEQNPLVGERIVELTNIRSEEPDPTLFQVPEGYTLKERSALPLGMPPSLPAAPDIWTPQIAEAESSPDAALKDQIAYKLASQNIHISAALALSEKAVSMEEQDLAKLDTTKDAIRASFDEMLTLSRYWNTLGFLYFRQGNMAQAEAYTRAAWELEPKGFVYAHLGRIYQHLDRRSEAITTYRMALSTEPSATEREQLQTYLTELGVPSAEPLPSAVIIPLPALTAHIASADAEPVVDILLTHDQPPIVTFLKGAPELRAPVTTAIQRALAAAIPDSGPEKVLRRARVSCESGETPTCALHFASSQEARDAGSSPGNLGLTPLLFPN
jgi:tetratricopeptide (TPR) repeat protein